MFTLLMIGLVVVAGMILLGALSAVGHLVGFVIALPFRLVGFVFRLVGFVLAVVFGALGLALAGGALLLPLVPFALAIAGIVWLIRRRPRPAH